MSRVRLITETGRSVFIEAEQANKMVKIGSAVVATDSPFVVISIEKLYTPEFTEEQRHLNGRLVKVTRTKTPCKSLMKNTSATSSNTRIKPPRKPGLCALEIELNRHRFLHLKHREEQERRSAQERQRSNHGKMDDDWPLGIVRRADYPSSRSSRGRVADHTTGH